MADYDFRTLSPSDFEILIRDLLQAENEWHLEAFGHGRDGGIDLRASTAAGQIVIQCKHYLGSSFSDLRSSARREVSKMSKENPDRYLFVTSQDLNRTQKDTLAGDLKPWISDTADLLTQKDINDLITRHPAVEQQHFKLWLASTTILERIVQSGIWSRSEALLEDIRDRVKLYVPTHNFIAAYELLNEKHVVVLTGAPGVGKSMLAEMLALRYWHEGWQIVSVGVDVDDAWDAYKPGRRQVFLYDDFLGQTDLSERRAKDSWITRFMSRVANNPDKRLVMTTRSQILQQTRLISEPIARADFQIVECVVKIADYGAVQRAQILYNHLYFSRLRREVVRDYVAAASYWPVVNHKNFSPRILELIINRPHSSAGGLAASLSRTLDHPLDLWRIVFNGLSDIAQRTTLTLASFPVSGVDPETLRRLVKRDSRPTDYTGALRVLEGTFIHVEKQKSGATQVAYANPSVRDFILAFLNEEPDYLMAIIEDAESVSQVSVLLSYAASEVSDKLRFKNSADAFTRHQLAITEKMKDLAAEVNGSPEQRRNTYRNLALPLIKALRPARRVMRRSFDELLVLTVEVLEGPASDFMDPDDWELFNKAIMMGYTDGAEKFRETLGWAFESWGATLYTIDNVNSFEEFYDAYASTLGQDFDPSEKYHESVCSGLRQEIENLSGNEQDQDSDHQWIDAVERTARRIGVLDDLRPDIESARESIFERYSGGYDPRDMPTSGAGYGRPGTVTSVSDRATIEGMFRELS